ncbi:unnamed protein product [Dicrocoelium dendriticum]|nr:unnamed protein product [Dicrocoelium dendriticum]
MMVSAFSFGPESCVFAKQPRFQELVATAVSAGTVINLGISEAHDVNTRKSSKYCHSLQGASYMLLTYTDGAMHTLKDEFVIGIQAERINSSVETHYQQNLAATCSLLYVANKKFTGDFLHVYLVGGYLHLDCDFGCGLMHITGKTGRQFNQQETIWLDVIPLINLPCCIPVFLVGVYYNGLLLNDLVAGIYHQVFVRVTTYGTVRHLQKISIRPAPGSPFTWVSNT